ncbi:uncharacterized protein [Montipora capricornis]|uniref:uncharacterized protein n=1 Tax=Montipora capricornis TaxID=246305 RepID=UPI0035F130F6
MCREVLDIEPYQFKLRSPERGKAWEAISSHLNTTSCPKFRVTPRSVRDRYNLLTKKLQARLNTEEKASGIAVNNSELDDLLEEILEKEKAAKEKLNNDGDDKKKSLENEKVAAEDMRKRALERVGQTTKRKDKEEGTETGPSKKKSRKSTGEAVEYLKERASTEIQLRERELEMRKKEQESMSQRERERNEQQDKVLSTMLKQQDQQQQMMMMLMNQQQQQSQALMSLIGKIVPK